MADIRWVNKSMSLPGISSRHPRQTNTSKNLKPIFTDVTGIFVAHRYKKTLEIKIKQKLKDHKWNIPVFDVAFIFETFLESLQNHTTFQSVTVRINVKKNTYSFNNVKAHKTLTPAKPQKLFFARLSSWNVKYGHNLHMRPLTNERHLKKQLLLLIQTKLHQVGHTYLLQYHTDKFYTFHFTQLSQSVTPITPTQQSFWHTSHILVYVRTTELTVHCQTCVVCVVWLCAHIETLA